MNEDIYNNAIIEWSKRTAHADHLEYPDKKGTASNPLCGDQITVELRMEDRIIRSMAVQVRGCILCKASSFHLAEFAEGLTLDRIKMIRHDLENMLKSADSLPPELPEAIRMFLPVRPHKSRHACVLLPYDAVINAASLSRNLNF
jgi:nitrogen fixation NifU-like protein